MKTWNIQKTQYKVADFLSWQKGQELELSPSFQRRAVWQPGAKSYLIDTILRGLPIPPIIIREKPPDLSTYKASRQVIDGQQRIRTLISFISSGLLEDFDPQRDHFVISKSHNAELAGSTFEKLADELKARILDYQFMVHVFPTDTDDRDVLEIFARMNATGYKLTNQELRNARFFGEFKTHAFKIAAEQLSRWRNWRIFNETSIARMAEVEFVSELLILILSGITEGSKKTIDRYYQRYDDAFPNVGEVSRRFRQVMDAIDANFDDSSRSPFEKKTLFYPFFAAVYDVMYGLGSDLSRSKPKPLTRDAAKGLADRGARIESGTANAEIVTISQRRVSQAGVRRKLMAYIRGSG